MVLVYAGMLKVTVHPAFEVTWKSPMLMVVLPLKLCSPRLLISPEPAETFPLISTVAPLLAATTSNAFSQAGIVISIGDLLLSAACPNVYSGLPNFFCHCISTSGICNVYSVLPGIHAFDSSAVI